MITRFSIAAASVGLALVLFVPDVSARSLRNRHRHYAHNQLIIPTGPAASAGALFGLVDTGISPTTDAYPGFAGIAPGYGFYGHGYYGPGFGSPGY